ncbi:MAG TPA: type II toxin-antitoxin system RelE/ParE family toxin [Candidatus Angelobacter sp.]|nr:type II toxin-antitoxin system RelE/ParE family toxin [Candidatus Angelobacter sp.]
MKAAIFHPAARAAIRSFPEDVRQELGKAIYDLQKGEVLAMPLSRPMPSIEPGAAELRIRDRSGIYRVFYYSRSPRGILVFHAFVKKTQTTLVRELDLGKKRLRELLLEEV